MPQPLKFVALGRVQPTPLGLLCFAKFIAPHKTASAMAIVFQRPVSHRYLLLPNSTVQRIGRKRPHADLGR
jgi:hypothetical protein